MNRQCTANSPGLYPIAGLKYYEMRYFINSTLKILACQYYFMIYRGENRHSGISGTIQLDHRSWRCP